MLVGKLGRRYGKAVFELSAGREDAVATELDSYLDAFVSSDLNKLLDNPAFNVGDRKTVALEVAAALELSESARNLIAILVDKRRMTYLPSIVEHYHQLLDNLKNQINATLIVPKTLDDGKRKEMAELVGELSGKQAVLKEQVDPSIIGGLVIEVGGKVYDGSVRTQLRELKENIERTI